ncbi:unnamed protein product [Clavelina lepadiformis]|uniref:Uncharacterized protein n=1 Tax=Clavelina lepadiformis TaxID=159417 RepID=A0ABP0GVN8_CLALP
MSDRPQQIGHPLKSSSMTSSYRPTENRYLGDETNAFIKQLQQQLENIRSENHDLMENTAQLQKKINQLQEEKVTMSNNFNRENASLQAAVAQVQAQVERGEATRQSLEYELAVSKKRSVEIMRNNTHKEVTLSKQNIILSDEKSSLELHLGEMENELALARKVTAENETRIAFLEDDKKQLESNSVAAEAILRAENDKLANQIEDLSYQKEQISSKLDDAKECLIKQEEDLRRTVTDLQISMEREQRVRHDLDEITQRAHSLEESVEAERAAHLESKFNSEIIQLKHQEFQELLEKERDSSDNLKQEVEEANMQIEQLEKQLEYEKRHTNNAQEKLDKSEQVFADVRKKLDQELTVKSHLIEEMTGKLDEHEQHLEQLKQELSKARKRQIFLEETYGGNVRELELLLDNFCLDSCRGISTKSKGKEKSKSSKKDLTDHPKTVLEELRKTLFAYQKRISDLEHEVDNRISAERQTQKDCNTFRDLALTREKSLQLAQQELAQNNQELENIRAQHVEYERESGKTFQDLKDVTTDLQQQTERCHRLEEKVNAVQERHSNEIEVHIGYLRELHHVVCNTSGEKNALNRFTWSDLSVTLREALDTLVNMYQRSKDKVKQLETSCQEMERSISELQRAHESSVDRLAERCRERDDEAGRQRKQLEQHYEALLAEMHARTQKTQSLCDEAWERVRSNDGVHDGLQAECAQLRGENSNLQQERKSLACACAILFGALYPTLRARDELVQQRSLLVRINNDGEACKQKMRLLVDTLNEEMRKPKEKARMPVAVKSFSAIHPLIRFRVAVVCVLAARRLRLFTEESNVPMFTCNESAISSSRIIVVAGKGEKKTPRMKSKSDVPIQSRSDAAVDWLSNNHVIHSVRDATCGVVDAVAKNKGDTSGYMSRAVAKTAKNAFLNLMEATYTHFPSYTVDARNIIRERTSLCRVLADGLDRIIHRAGLQQVVNLFSVEHSFSALQRHLLTFTERLHAAEVEKRSLRNNELNLRTSLEQLNICKVELEKKEEKMKKLKEKEKELVARGRFDGVCAELSAALEREKRAQGLLHEQNDKLQEMSQKFEEQCTDGAERDVTLTQAVSSLTEVKMELKRCTHAKRQLEKQLDRLQHDRNTLNHQVDDAKKALKKAAVEKTTIANYFATLEKTLQYADDEEISSKLQKQGQEIGKGGPGMKAAQRAVESFVRVQSSAIGRINNLESQIASYRSHITSLKRELHNVCQRENENTPDYDLGCYPTKDDSQYTRSQTLLSSTPYGGPSEFIPLQGEIVHQASFENGLSSTHRISDPTTDKAIRDLTNTYGV